MNEIDITDPKFTTVNVPQVISEAFQMSKSAARRMLEQDAVKVDGEKWKHLTGCGEDFHGKVLQVGKRKFVRIQVEGMK